MPELTRLIIAPAVLAAAFGMATAFPSTAQVSTAAVTDDTRVPGEAWTSVKPELVGYSSPRLEILRSWLKTLDTKAMVIAVHGQVIFEHGDLAHASKIASVRKSVLSMLYGPYILSGRIDPRKTVVEMGLEEAEPFLPIETHATLEHLLTARSGIYLRSGNDNLDAVAPKRGSEPPGMRMQYNNWDFNAAGTAFEKLSGKTIYQALEEDLARPLGMQDFDPKKQGKGAEPGIGASRVRDATLDARPGAARPADAATWPLAGHAGAASRVGAREHVIDHAVRASPSDWTQHRWPARSLGLWRHVVGLGGAAGTRRRGDGAAAGRLHRHGRRRSVRDGAPRREHGGGAHHRHRRQRPCRRADAGLRHHPGDGDHGPVSVSRAVLSAGHS
jgi:CubicO group peptidase (beta-lactamase class C family)